MYVPRYRFTWEVIKSLRLPAPCPTSLTRCRRGFPLQRNSAWNLSLPRVSCAKRGASLEDLAPGGSEERHTSPVTTGKRGYSCPGLVSDALSNKRPAGARSRQAPIPPGPGPAGPRSRRAPVRPGPDGSQPPGTCVPLPTRAPRGAGPVPQPALEAARPSAGGALGHPGPAAALTSPRQRLPGPSGRCHTAAEPLPPPRPGVSRPPGAELRLVPPRLGARCQPGLVVSFPPVGDEGCGRAEALRSPACSGTGHISGWWRARFSQFVSLRGWAMLSPPRPGSRGWGAAGATGQQTRSSATAAPAAGRRKRAGWRVCRRPHAASMWIPTEHEKYGVGEWATASGTERGGARSGAVGRERVPRRSSVSRRQRRWPRCPCQRPRRPFSAQGSEVPAPSAGSGTRLRSRCSSP